MSKKHDPFLYNTFDEDGCYRERPELSVVDSEGMRVVYKCDPNLPLPEWWDEAIDAAVEAFMHVSTAKERS
jgi:hypothetical protein